MQQESINILKRIINTPSPSGYEQPVQRIIREELAYYVDSMETDIMGNVIGVRNEKGYPRVMLTAHCDEIGLMVKFIDDNGFIYFSAIGGVDSHLTPGQRVKIHGKQGDVLGVIGKKPYHLIKESEKQNVIELSKQWIDIGAENKQAVENVIQVGDPITFDVSFNRLGTNGLIVGRGFDDKAATFVNIEVCRLLAIKNIHKAAVFSVSSVQEEVGLRGAITSAYKIKPDIGITIDLDFATDNPGVDNTEVGELSLGKGPIISRGSRINPIVEELLIQTAIDEKIPYQLRAEPSRSGTDTDSIQISRSGVATALISIPSRYMHTPCEVISLKDLEFISKLLAAFIERLDDFICLIPQ